MAAALQIGADVSKDHINNVTKAITAIFDSAFANHMDQQTIVHALDTLAKTTKVENVMVQHCNFKMKEMKGT